MMESTGAKQTTIELRTPLEGTVEGSEKRLSSYLVDILSLALPNAGSNVCFMLQIMTCLYFVGLLNDVRQLDGVSLGVSWSAIFGASIISGLAGAMDTFIPQSFGQGDFEMCGRYFNRSIVLVSLAALPCYGLMVLAGPLFRFIGVDPVVASLASNCVLAMIPSLTLLPLVYSIDKFLAGQRIVQPQTVVQCLLTALYPLYCYLGTFVFGFGYLGIAFAKLAGYFTYAALLVVYIFRTEACSRCLVRFSWDVFKDWREFAGLALPSMLMVCWEWWACEIMNVFCARLGNVELAANTIGSNYAAMIYLVCTALGTGTATFVGNMIGEGNSHQAKRYAVIGIMLSEVVILCLDVVLILSRDFTARIFTSDEQVVACLRWVIFFVALQEICDGLQGTCGRILMAMGRQAQASWIALISYYVFMIPLGYLLGFYYALGILGIWISYIVAALIAALGYGTIALCQDWKLLIEEARNRGAHADA